MKIRPLPVLTHDALLDFVTRYEVQPNGCWLWTGSMQHGYGRFTFGVRMRGPAHRFAYEARYGPIPDGLVVDHLCHTRDQDCPGGECVHRRCVNPGHMEAVPIKVNVLRGKTLTRAHAEKTHCPKGHPYDYVYKGERTTFRSCRTCRRESSKRSRPAEMQKRRERRLLA